MTLNYLSVCDMLDLLKQTGSATVSYEADNCLQRIQSFADSYDSLCTHSQIVENRCNELVVEEFMRAILTYGSELDKRVVYSFMSSELSLAGDC